MLEESQEVPQIVIEKDEGRLIIRPAAARRQICTPEARITYMPGSPVARVIAGVPESPLSDYASVLYEYVTVTHGTLEQLIQVSAKMRCLPSVSDVSLGKVACRLLEWRTPDDRIVKVWVVPSMGSMITKVEQLEKNVLSQQWSARLRKYKDGVFWFDRVEEKTWRRGSPSRHKIIKIVEFVVNEPIDEKVFTLDGMDIPAGTEIEDKVLNIRYRYGEPVALEKDSVNKVLTGEDAPPPHREKETKTPTLEKKTVYPDAEIRTPTSAPRKPLTQKQLKTAQIPLRHEQASSGRRADWIWYLAAAAIPVLAICILAVRLQRRRSAH